MARGVGAFLLPVILSRQHNSALNSLRRAPSFLLVFVTCLSLSGNFSNADTDAASNPTEDAKRNLFVAVFAGKVPPVRAVLETGIDINSTNVTGVTPLMLASLKGYHELVIVLLEERANPNLQDKFGMTALMAASMMGHPKIAESLIRKGAKLDMVSNNKMTALSFAVSQSQGEMVSLLLSKNVDVAIKNSDGLTALELAEKNGNTAIAKLIKSKKTPEQKDQ